MHRPSSLSTTTRAADGMSAAGASQARPGRPPPADGGQASPGRAATSPATVTRDPSEDHGELAQRLNDVVVRRIFAAGLDLQGALWLIGEQRGATKIHHAVEEMDQAIRDIRDILFDRR
jgi:hypothetical protein